MRPAQTFELYVDYLFAHLGQVSAVWLSEIWDKFSPRSYDWLQAR